MQAQRGSAQVRRRDLTTRRGATREAECPGWRVCPGTNKIPGKACAASNDKPIEKRKTQNPIPLTGRERVVGEVPYHTQGIGPLPSSSIACMQWIFVQT